MDTIQDQTKRKRCNKVKIIDFQ